MKTLIISLLISSFAMASTPAKENSLSDMYTVKVQEESEGVKKIRIAVGLQQKQIVIKSINNLCVQRNLSCSLSESGSGIISYIDLEVKGSKSDLKNIEKLIK